MWWLIKLHFNSFSIPPPSKHSITKQYTKNIKRTHSQDRDNENDFNSNIYFLCSIRRLVCHRKHD